VILNSSDAKNKILRVGIVDDSVLIQQLLHSVISETSGMEVVGVASDAHQARAMIKEVNPDVITLDVEMPHMNGVDFLEKIMTLRPMPVIMVSTLTQKGADTTLKALEIGALDYVAKPSKIAHSKDLIAAFQKELIPKLNMARFSNIQQKHTISVQKQEGLPTKSSQFDLIGIASSTGGIERLRYIFSNIKINLPPVVIVQHINHKYVDNMIERFQLIIPPFLKVQKASHGSVLQNNTIYFAGNEHHLHVQQNGYDLRFCLTDEPPLNGFKASADYLFESMAQLNTKKQMAFILSGMGNDGAEGLLTLKNKGIQTYGESDESCLIYGMPKMAKEKGAITKELSVQNIVKQINIGI
jgi:two-component system chemotaxis response regulator CheB